MALAQINGQKIHYEDSQGDGPAILFMHGFLMDQTMFDSQVQALASSYRCVRFDARAFGHTEWDGQPFGLYDTVADGIALLDHLGIGKATVVGMSMGGYAALRMAIKHPDRVKSLVLIGSRHRADPPEGQAQYIEARDTWKAHGPVPPLVQGLMGAIIGPQEQNAAHWDVWTPKWEAVSGDSYYAATNCLLERDDLTDEQVRAINHSALIVHGEADMGVPIENGEALNALLPNSSGLVRVAGASHAANMTHPGAVNPPLFEFLSNNA